ncbi:unnamed protein product [Sphenostylis stenocarpa]|uniref:UBC core domain-containing protein n=1 Tax=Sphenostylis stenocarpa TaxID=92480 RepID=A0AA86S3N4_9FABA|nr:unnamed protein product [Sphenostylis stenocarpa]
MAAGTSNNVEPFDVVSDDTDHYFLMPRPEMEGFGNKGSNVYKRIMREWKILAQSLPDSIYVRVYEKRIDLLRATIVGAAGTPYHDGLFFFDIAFPPGYPINPPEVHYRSYGYFINPNLYSDGHVCLSLINTWIGKTHERWDPCRSTVLQLLLSIQALVLNDKPFFNDFWAEILGRGRVLLEKQSRAYNDAVFVLNCRTMLCLLRRPPLNFETFVVCHFRNQARAILSACDDYANGRVKVGHYGVDGKGSKSKVRVSGKLRESLVVLYPQLFKSFVRSGAFSGSEEERLRMEKRNGLCKSNVSRTKYRVIVRKVIGRIKKLYS